MSAIIPGPAYRVVTPRLVLRCWNPADAPLLKAAIDANLQHLYPWMPWIKDEPTDLQAMIERMRRFRGEFDAGMNFVYGVFNPEESEVWGGTGLHPRAGRDALEIGYWIHGAHVRQGLATETAGTLARVAFEVHRVSRVEIHCVPENQASATVARKLGFIHEATLRKRLETADGLMRDGMIWTLLAEEYPTSLAAKSTLKAYDALGRRIL